MRTVIYDTESAILKFAYDQVSRHLKQRISDHNLPENGRQLELLLNSTEDIIEIDQDDHSFGFIILELIDAGAGRITCKKCDQTYNSSDLKPITLGAGKSPINPNIDIKWSLRTMFRRRKRNPSLIGGYGYKCSAGHKLIAMIHWQT